MSMSVQQYLQMGSVEAISEHLAKAETSMDGPNGNAAAVAVHILTMRDVERTLRELDKASSRLQHAALVLAAVSLAVAVVGVLVAVADLWS